MSWRVTSSRPGMFKVYQRATEWFYLYGDEAMANDLAAWFNGDRRPEWMDEMKPSGPYSLEGTNNTAIVVTAGTRDRRSDLMRQWILRSGATGALPLVSG